MITQSIIQGDKQEAERLKRYFGFKRDLVLRAVHVFYYELVKLVPSASAGTTPRLMSRSTGISGTRNSRYQRPSSTTRRLPLRERAEAAKQQQQQQQQQQTGHNNWSASQEHLERVYLEEAAAAAEAS